MGNHGREVWRNVHGVFRALLRLIGEAQQRAPGGPRERLVLGALCRLVDARVGLMLWQGVPPGRAGLAAMFEVGLATASRRALRARLVRLACRATGREAHAEPPPCHDRAAVAPAAIWRGRIDEIESAERGGEGASNLAPIGGALLLASRRSPDAPLCQTIVLHRPRAGRAFGDLDADLLELLLTDAAWLFPAPVPGGGRHMIAPAPAAGTDERPLPRRLRQVLAEVLAGNDAAQIARKLHLSRCTVYEHMGRLYRREGVRNRKQLAARFRAVPSPGTLPT